MYRHWLSARSDSVLLSQQESILRGAGGAGESRRDPHRSQDTLAGTHVCSKTYVCVCVFSALS